MFVDSVNFVDDFPTEQIIKSFHCRLELARITRQQSLGHQNDQGGLQLLGPNLHTSKLLLLIENLELSAEIGLIIRSFQTELGVRELKRALASFLDASPNKFSEVSAQVEQLIVQVVEVTVCEPASVGSHAAILFNLVRVRRVNTLK